MKIGVLALQGAFIEHENMLNKIGVEYFEIRQLKDLEKKMDGLIIPGGESTVMGKLLHDLKLFDPLQKLIQNGLPTFGTCAGLILLAKELSNDPNSYFKCIDIKVKRNAYGRQLGSFTTKALFKDLGMIPMTFIRAPYIESIGKNVEVLAIYEGKFIAVKENNILVTAFHPELTDDTSVHKYFIKIIKDSKKD